VAIRRDRGVGRQAVVDGIAGCRECFGAVTEGRKRSPRYSSKESRREAGWNRADGLALGDTQFPVRYVQFDTSEDTLSPLESHCAPIGGKIGGPGNPQRRNEFSEAQGPVI
jgi:hypothetical protein